MQEFEPEERTDESWFSLMKGHTLAAVHIHEQIPRDHHRISENLQMLVSGEYLIVVIGRGMKSNS